MPMSPEILACLERLSAGRARERSVVGVDPLVKSDGGRVLEALAAVSTLALVQVAVTIQVVLLEVNPQFEADVALVTAVRPLFPTYRYNQSINQSIRTI